MSVALSSVPGRAAGQGSAAQGTSTSNPALRPIIPIKVDVVISRYQAEKKTGSLPYSLMINANGPSGQNRTSLRMGVDVPIGQTTRTENGVTTSQMNYRNVGTSIDSNAETDDAGRFRVYVSISHSAIVTADQSATPLRMPDPTSFRQFTTTNYLSLKDGQSVQFIMATDNITGEVLKVDVSVTVIK
jgi:hypothetical protein